MVGPVVGFDTDAVPYTLAVQYDSDGVPLYTAGSNMALDTDGVPFVSAYLPAPPPPAIDPNVPPFKITLYNAAMSRLGWLGDPISCQFTPRHMAIGDMSITVQAGHKKLGMMLAEGSRITVDYHGTPLMSGRMSSWQQQGGQTDGLVTVSYADDLSVWWSTLGWPNPSQIISAQNTLGVINDKVTGPAETVAKTFMTRNGVTRLGNPVTVAATHGYGSTIVVSFRMVPLADNLITVVDQAGVGLSAIQSGTSIVVDAYQPRTYPHTLTERSGVIIPGTISYTASTATRTVVAGPGVGTSREWLERVSTARETALNWKMEVLTDASSTDVTTERQAAGDAALAAAGPKSGFSLGLSETASFRYGASLHVGDRVTLDLGGGQLLTDILREVTLSWSRDNGLNVTPTVGDRTDDPNRRLISYLVDVAQKVRGLIANK